MARIILFKCAWDYIKLYAYKLKHVYICIHLYLRSYFAEQICYSLLSNTSYSCPLPLQTKPTPSLQERPGICHPHGAVLTPHRLPVISISQQYFEAAAYSHYLSTRRPRHLQSVPNQPAYSLSLPSRFPFFSVVPQHIVVCP